MKILGIGDSFMHGDINRKAIDFLLLTSNALNAESEMIGMSGTGPWNSFFKFLNYKDKESLDVVIFAWSEATRLYYHDHNIPLNSGTVLYKMHRDKKSVDEIYNAAEQYYLHLYDYEKQGYEAMGIYYIIDDMAKKYPNIKFIHMFCFAHNSDISFPHMEVYDKKTFDHLEYLYTFQNGINIKPALMYLSRHCEEYPTNGIEHDHRSCHMGVKMHQRLADTLVDAIQNGKNGDTFTVKL